MMEGETCRKERSTAARPGIMKLSFNKTGNKRPSLFRTTVITFLISLFFLIGVPVITKAWYTPYASLSIYAFGDPGAKAASGNHGHTWLTITNISKKEIEFMGFPIAPDDSISISIWPDSLGPAGVFINREMVVEKGKKCATYSIDVRRDQLDKIAEATPAESYYHDGLRDDFWHNCTTYSVKMWNMVADKDHKISNGTAGVDVPGTVANKIMKWKGAKRTTFSVKRTKYWANVYHVSRSGTATAMDNILLNKRNVTVGKNKKITLKAHFNKSKEINSQIKWKSDKPGVATVSNGTVTGIRPGKCTISAYYEGVKGITTIIDNCTVKVIVPVTRITLDKSAVTIEKGRKTTVKIKSIEPSNATNKKVKWSSSDPKVATVTNKGVVTGVSPGTAKITATAVDGSKTKASCKVTVSSKSDVLRAYKKFLEGKKFTHYCKGVYKTPTLEVFRIMDINRDGVPELIVSSKNSTCSHNLSKFRNHCHISLLSYKNGKVKYLNGYLSKASKVTRIWYSSEKKRAYVKSYSKYGSFSYKNNAGELSRLPSGCRSYSFLANTKANRDKYCK